MEPKLSVVVTLVDGEPLAEVAIDYEELDDMCDMTEALARAAVMVHTRAHQEHELDKLRN